MKRLDGAGTRNRTRELLITSGLSPCFFLIRRVAAKPQEVPFYVAFSHFLVFPCFRLYRYSTPANGAQNGAQRGAEWEAENGHNQDQGRQADH